MSGTVFDGCTDQDYADEAIGLGDPFESKGESLVREISGQRDQASAKLEIENAAALHSRLDKLHPIWPSCPKSSAASIIWMDDGPAQRGLGNAFASFKLRVAGYAIQFPFLSRKSNTPRSEPTEFRVQKRPWQAFPLAAAASSLETMEHLALLKRWYHRRNRTGEVFFVDDTAQGSLPMRRVVLGIVGIPWGEGSE